MNQNIKYSYFFVLILLPVSVTFEVFPLHLLYFESYVKCGSCHYILHKPIESGFNKINNLLV